LPATSSSSFGSAECWQRRSCPTYCCLLTTSSLSLITLSADLPPYKNPCLIEQLP
jgi:hypothetical protein